MESHHTFEDYSRFGTNDFLGDAYFQEWAQQNNPEQQDFWQRFIQAYPHKAREVNEAREWLQQLQFKAQAASPGQVADMWQYIDEHTSLMKIRRLRRPRRRWVSVAAAVILFLLSFGLWQWFGTGTKQLKTADADIRKVVLPDQSEVLLNAGTTLRYPRHFGETAEREVWIKGEAFFSVTHRETDADHHPQPFIVHTPQLDIMVTGTAFNVNTRHEATTVVLNNGRVSVRFKKATLEDRVLQPGQMLEYAGGRITQQQADTLRITAWKERKFIFTNTPLKEAARQIGDFYGYKVVLKDSALYQYKINADLNIPDISTLEEVFSNALNVRISRTGRTLEFSEK